MKQGLGRKFSKRRYRSLRLPRVTLNVVVSVCERNLLDAKRGKRAFFVPFCLNLIFGT